MSIVGLGWGRATRTSTLSESVRGESPAVSVGGLAADSGDVPTVGDAGDAGGTGSRQSPTPIGDEGPEDIPAAGDLFELGTTARVIALQNVVPVLATVAAYLVFRLVPVV